MINVRLMNLLFFLLAGCSQPDGVSDAQKMNLSEARDRLTKCWNVEPLKGGNSRYRIYYKMYVSMDAGPWVGISEKCKKMYISFSDPKNLFPNAVQQINQDRGSKPFDSVVIGVDVVGKIKEQPYNSINLEYELEKIEKVTSLEIDADSFYNRYVKAFR